MSEEKGSLTTQGTTAPSTPPVGASATSLSAEAPKQAEFVEVDDVDALPDDPKVLKSALQGMKSHIAEIKKTHVPMVLEYQQYITRPPATKQQLWQQACSNDGVTAESWRETWIKHITENVNVHGADEHMVDQLFGKHKYMPGICAGSGPSLKKNIKVLAKDKPDEFPVHSALHNYAFMVDNDVDCEYFFTLDAGPVTLTEVYEGGTKPSEYYWDSTKDKTLVAGLPCLPALIEKWQGKVYWFNATIPDPVYMQEMMKITKNKWVYSVGGNVLGAAVYHSLFVSGCCPTVMLGADFAFGYDRHFHSWDSDYDKKFAGVLPVTDVFGNRVYTWPSYFNFKSYFDFLSMGGNSGHPVQMINCSEGGTLGAYPEGNIVSIKQMSLEQFFGAYKNFQKYPELMAESAKKGQEFIAMI